MISTYPLLGQLAGALVLAVAEQFDNATLVWGKTVVELASVHESHFCLFLASYSIMVEEAASELDCRPCIELSRALSMFHEPFTHELLRLSSPGRQSNSCAIETEYGSQPTIVVLTQRLPGQYPSRKQCAC